MNVLLITNLFPTPVDPERGVFTLQLVKHLNRHCNVTVVCPLPWFPPWGPMARIDTYRQYSAVPENYIVNEIEVYSPKYPLIPKVSGPIHAQLMLISLRRCIKKLAKTRKFDLVNSHWLYPDGVAAAHIADSLGIPHVPTGLGCDINRDLYDTVKKRQIINTLERSDALIVVSNALKQEIKENRIRQRNISVIPNGIDFDKFGILQKNDCREKLGVSSETPIFLFVGRLSQEKGVANLIEAAARIIQTGDRLNLYLVGEGEIHDELAGLASTLGISSQVHFVGKVKHSEINCWMGAADYFCLPSLREGCPNVMLEALSCGRPVLASKVGAIPDIVNEKTGILFEPQDVNSITHALKAATVHAWDSGTIHRSVQGLSWEETAKKYFGVFREVLKC